MNMQQKIEDYESNLQHEIKDSECLDSEIIYEISEQWSQHRWYGLESTQLTKVTLGNNEVIYTVETESATELVKQNKSHEEIWNVLYENRLHETGDYELVAIFDTEKEARDFIEKEYPPIDVKKVLTEILESK